MMAKTQREPKWNDENIITEVKPIILHLGHFPTRAELLVAGVRGVAAAIDKNGGSNKFRGLLGAEILKVPDGYWTKEKTLEELKKLKVDLSHFPTETELIAIGRNELRHAVHKNGGMNKSVQNADGHSIRTD